MNLSGKITTAATTGIADTDVSHVQLLKRTYVLPVIQNLLTQRMRTEVAHHTVDDLVPQKVEEEATYDIQPDVPQVCASMPDEAGCDCGGYTDQRLWEAHARRAAPRACGTSDRG